jgi:addiction module HigA family antidote
MSRSRTTIDAAHREAFSGFEPEDLMMRIPTHRPPPHAGETLREDYLPDFGWSAADLAARLRVPVDTIDAVLAEKAPVTPDLALRLGRLFGQTPGFWIRWQLGRDLYFALKAAAADLDEIVPVDAEPPVRKAS